MNPNFYSHMLNTCLYSLSAMALMFFGFKLFDWVTPWMDFKKDLVENKNVAVAIVVGSFVLGIAIVMHAILSTP